MTVLQLGQVNLPLQWTVIKRQRLYKTPSGSLRASRKSAFTLADISADILSDIVKHMQVKEPIHTSTQIGQYVRRRRA